MSIKILATLGPASLSEKVVRELTSNGVSLFRINLSHTLLDDVESIIKKVQLWTEVPICLDSEGAQVRNQKMLNEAVNFKKGSTILIHHEPVVGDSENISFAPKTVSKQLKVGDRIKVDFNSVCFRVLEDKEDGLLAEVEHGGCVGSNKAADVDSDINLDALTDKDKAAFEIGLKFGIRDFSLSFTNSASDVKELRDIIGSDANLISKIESIQGVYNLDEILPIVDSILIDRGDLSREVAIEKIPFLQRRIIASARLKETPVFVATNLLESMINADLPTRAEANDVASTLLMGANGLVLAAETAIGKNPIGSVKMINLIIEQYNRWTPESSAQNIIS